jgi:outer membrane protein OmpA-like peptidoglycan-associated protein
MPAVTTSLQRPSRRTSSHRPAPIQSGSVSPQRRIVASTPTPFLPVVQAKLRIGEPNDKYEQEAGRVADKVMHMPARSFSSHGFSVTPATSREAQCTCEQRDEQDGQLQRKESGSATESRSTAPSIVDRTLNSPGQPLETTTRAYFESCFGRGFSEVRVHTDEWAAKSAGAVNALAYTAGQDIAFGTGQYAPRSETGRWLLAHELTHVLQQGTTPAPDSTLLRQEAGVDVDTDNDEMEPVDVDFDKETPPVEVEDFGGEAPILRFGFNSTTLRQDAEVDSVVQFSRALQVVDQYLQDAGQEGHVLVLGYASEEGEEAHNLTLSQARADRVRDLLVDAGIREDRITSKGEGPNDAFPGLAWNRRVEITFSPPATFLSLEGAEVSASICAFPKENFPYDERTFALIEAMAEKIVRYSAAHDVPPVAVAGAIADEYNTSRDLKAVVDWFQDVGWLPHVFNWAIAVHQWIEIPEKLAWLGLPKKLEELLSKMDPREHDIGAGNIKLKTAMELQEEYPGILEEKNYAEMVDHIAKVEGTVQLATLTIRKARDELDTHVQDYTAAGREAVYITYYKQGEDYVDRFKKSLATDPNHRITPGEGCRVYLQRDHFLQALGISE